MCPFAMRDDMDAVVTDYVAQNKATLRNRSAWLRKLAFEDIRKNGSPELAKRLCRSMLYIFVSFCSVTGPYIGVDLVRRPRPIPQRIVMRQARKEAYYAS